MAESEPNPSGPGSDLSPSAGGANRVSTVTGSGTANKHDVGAQNGSAAGGGARNKDKKENREPLSSQSRNAHKENNTPGHHKDQQNKKETGETTSKENDNARSPSKSRPKSHTVSKEEENLRAHSPYYKKPKQRPATSVGVPTQRPGFDNSDRNPFRRSIGSCTDKVAAERRIFGAWKEPDPEIQRRLVERLAPAKPPAPPDPQFDHWVNHFEYYETIGIDIKPRIPGNYAGYCSSSHEGQGYRTQYHRLLKRPRTTTGRISGRRDNGYNDDMNEGGHGDGPYSGSSHADRMWGQSRLSQSSGYSKRSVNSEVVSGLDRRYMGLQKVNGNQMQDIVDRLTKMTSAYSAKFAPNPHVWVDTAPGAHMVKRGNTIA